MLPLSTELKVIIYCYVLNKLWFSDFDATRIQIFLAIAHFSRFVALSHYHIIDSSYITFMPLKKFTIGYIKVHKDIDYGFNGFDTPFSKNLIEIFQFCLFCLNCQFCLTVIFTVFLARMKFPL